MEIRTCSSTLLAPGRCCQGTCHEPAVNAVLYGDLVEHTRCAEHSVDVAIVAVKPLLLDPTWAG